MLGERVGRRVRIERTKGVSEYLSSEALERSKRDLGDHVDFYFRLLRDLFLLSSILFAFT